MYCSRCGTSNDDNAHSCRTCGAPVAATSVPGDQVQAPNPNTSGKAVTSLVCGLFAWIFPAAILAIVFGHISRSEIAQSGGRLKGASMALAGLILGYAGAAVVPFVLIIAAIAIPNLLRAKIAANEASAVGSIRTINEAEISYKAMYPNVGYATQLSNLGGAQPCTPSATTACLLSRDLAAGSRHGYQFAVSGTDPSGGPNTGYAIGGAPFAFNQSGVRRFCSTEDQIIRWDSNMERSTVPPDRQRCKQFAPLQ